MPLPVGTYTIHANGAAGSLVIGSTASGTFNGSVFNQPISGFFDEADQEFSFIQVTSPDLSTFNVYHGTLFTFSPTIGTIVQTLAGEFLSYPSTGPATPLTWFAQLSQKTKEKEGKDGKDKEQSKDTKDVKDRKDHIKENFKELEHPPQSVPMTDVQTMLMQIETRLAALEQQFAVGRSFISPSERPAVGTKASAHEPKKG
jgi:hypothetical protein